MIEAGQTHTRTLPHHRRSIMPGYSTPSLTIYLYLTTTRHRSPSISGANLLSCLGISATLNQLRNHRCGAFWRWVVRCFIDATLEHSWAPGAYVQAVRAPLLPVVISEEVPGLYAVTQAVTGALYPGRSH